MNFRERAAAEEVVRRVRRVVPADLFQSLLFGSRARGDARPDSDVDILLIFRALPPDREPQASQAEEIAEAVAAESGVPVATWSVALVDLAHGRRTPMLVDALADGMPLWPADLSPPRLRFTPRDAVRCTGALLQRVREGGEKVARLLAADQPLRAARRVRGDLVRLCTATLLLRGETRPRRADAVRRFLELHGEQGWLPAGVLAHLDWAMRSFGPDGQDEARQVEPPPGGFARVGATVDLLAAWVAAHRDELDARLSSGQAPWPAAGDGTPEVRTEYHPDARRRPFDGPRRLDSQARSSDHATLPAGHP